MNRRKIINKVLLVEGKIDKFAIAELMEANGVPWENPPIHIEDCEGYKNLAQPKLVSTELRESKLEALGIVVDADKCLNDRWQSIREVCQHSIRDLPELSSTGLLHNHNVTPERQVRFGIWIMPDNQSRGMLETFLTYLIPDEGDPLWDYAKEATEIARTQKQAQFIDAHLEKAQLHTWLAWQKPPGEQLHIAMRKKLFDLRHPRAQAFVTWFKELYDL